MYGEPWTIPGNDHWTIWYYHKEKYWMHIVVILTLMIGNRPWKVSWIKFHWYFGICYPEFWSFSDFFGIIAVFGCSALLSCVEPLHTPLMRCTTPSIFKIKNRAGVWNFEPMTLCLQKLALTSRAGCPQ